MNNKIRSPPCPEYILRTDKGEITSVAFGIWKDDSYLLTGHANGYLQIWDLNTYRSKYAWIGHLESRISWVGWMPDSSIISQGRDGDVKFWDIREDTVDCTDCWKSTCFSHCCCSVTNEAPYYLAVPQEESSVDVIKVSERSEVLHCKSKSASEKLGVLMCCQLMRRNNDLLLFCGYESGVIVLWSQSSDEMRFSSRLKLYEEPVMCINFNQETMRGVAGGTDDRLMVWEVDSSMNLVMKTSVKLTNAGTSQLIIHPRAIYVAVACWDCSLRIFSWKTMKALAVLKVHTEPIQCLAFSRSLSKPILAAGSRNSRVSLWNLYNDKLKVNA